MRVLRSAEIVCVVFAKVQSCGDCGGVRKLRIAPGRISTIGYDSRIRRSDSTAFSRNGQGIISLETSPRCGVYMLNQMRFTSGRFDQSSANSSRYPER